MIDQAISRLERPKRVTKEHYLKWRDDPVTKAMFHGLMVGYLRTLEDELPVSADAMPRAFHREGAYLMIKELFEWEPEFTDDEGLS